MKVLEGQDSGPVEDYVKQSLDDSTVVFSDKATNYVDIADHVEAHMTVISDKNSTNDTLKWVHIAISNAKRSWCTQAD